MGDILGKELLSLPAMTIFNPEIVPESAAKSDDVYFFVIIYENMYNNINKNFYHD